MRRSQRTTEVSEERGAGEKTMSQLEDEGWVMSWEGSLDQDADGFYDSLPHYIQQVMKITFNN